MPSFPIILITDFQEGKNQGQVELWSPLCYSDNWKPKKMSCKKSHLIGANIFFTYDSTVIIDFTSPSIIQTSLIHMIYVPRHLVS